MAFFTKVKNLLDTVPELDVIADDAKYLGAESLAEENNLTKKQVKFLVRFLDNRNNPKEIGNLVAGCFKQNIWAPFCWLVSHHYSLSDMPKLLEYYYDDIPSDIRAPVFALLCYRTQWSYNNYISLLNRALQDLPEDLTFIPEDLPEKIEVYKAVPWVKTIGEVIKEPCWSMSYDSRIRLSSLNMECAAAHHDGYKSPYGSHSISGVNTCSFQIVKAAINKEDILAFANANEFGYLSSDDVFLKKPVAEFSIVSAAKVTKDIQAELKKQESNFCDFNDRYNKINSEKDNPNFISELQKIGDPKANIRTTKLKTDLDKPKRVHELLDEPFEKMYYSFLINGLVEQGFPKTHHYSTFFNKEISEPEDVVNLVSSFENVPYKKLMANIKDLYDVTPNVVLTSTVANKTIELKKNRFYWGLVYSISDKLLFWATVKTPRKIDKVDPIYGVSIYINKNDVERITTTKHVVCVAVCLDSCGKTDDEMLHNLFNITHGIEDDDTEIKDAELFDLTDYVEIEKNNDNTFENELITDADRKEIKKDQLYQELDATFSKQIDMLEKDNESKTAEIEKLQKKIADLMKANDDLQKKVDELASMHSEKDNFILLKTADEPEKFDGETKMFVLSAVEKEAKLCKQNSRRKDVLTSVLDSNHEVLESLKDKQDAVASITKGYKYAEELKDPLKKLGFDYSFDGKHPKIQYPDDDRYCVTIASTPSDVKAGKNLASIINTKFF